MRGLGPVLLLATWERGIHEGALDRALTLLAAATGRSREDAASIDVGTRDAALSALLRVTAGEVVWGWVPCAGCGERLDVPVDLATLPRSPVREPGEVLGVEVGGVLVSFRLPSTEDLRMLSGLAPAGGRALLLRRCVFPAGENVPEHVAEAVEAAMEAASGGGAVELTVACPGCGTATAAALDVQLLLWADIEARAVALLHDVHTLATAYGWTEPDILALSPTRRAAYLELAGG